MKFINKVPGKYLYIISGVILAVIAAMVFLLYGYGRSSRDMDDMAEAESKYVYGTYVESKLADDVSWYLSGVDVIDKAAREEIADYSVQSYNAVISSGADTVTDEHSEALTEMFQNRLKEASDQLTDEECYALSSGISSYVWQAVLLSLNEYKASDMAPDYDAEYMELAESLQAQINALEERSMNIHITARLKDDGNGSGSNNEYKTEIEKYIGGAYETVNSSVDEKLDNMDDDINEKLDGMKDDITSELQKNLQNSMKDSMKDDMDKKIDSIKSEIASEVEKELKDSIKDGKDGKEGKEGAAGRNGQDGRDGADGKDGENGQDGKSTYVAYADDASGNGFSLTPTETSKYIGTCITTADKQPTNVSEYGNWQLYRNYIITSATDENNNTTLYIK